MNPEKYPVKPIQIDELSNIANLLTNMSQTSFQSRSLGNAYRIWSEMLKKKVFVFFGLAGAMIPAGMRHVIVYLLKNHILDCLVSTGANLFHDCHESLGFCHFKTSPQTDDIEFKKLNLDRIYDTFIVECELNRTDRFIAQFTRTLDPDHAYTSCEFLYALGKYLSENGNEKNSSSEQEGILTTAYKEKIPIFCPALGDSSIVIAIAAYMNKNKDQTAKKGLFQIQEESSRINFDLVREVRETAYLCAENAPTGIIFVGGGVPKNFIQQTEVTASLMKLPVTGHELAIQITTDAPHWGGLSGCTFEEAQSWGKIAIDARKVAVYCDATIALPILVTGLAQGCKELIQQKKESAVFQSEKIIERLIKVKI